MSPGLVTILMFATFFVLLVLGLPMAFTLAFAALPFALFVWGPASLSVIPGIVFTTSTNFILVAIPGFIFMSMILEKSGIADDMYSMMYKLFGPVRGGLALGTVVICALMAAMTGISATATISMGLIALPAMLRRGYNRFMAIGSIAAGGALGILIPPSNIFIIYGVMVGVSVGHLFIGGLLPGLLLTALFCMYIAIISYIKPQHAPALPPEERSTAVEKLKSLRAVILPILLIFAVLGSIYFGIATPTEASFVGATGSVACALVYRKLNWRLMREATYRSVTLTAMVMWIIIGAKYFTSVYIALGAPGLMRSMLADLNLSPTVLLIMTQVVFFILGCVLDPIAIVSICSPVFIPLITTMGVDPVWFGVLFVMNMEMGYLTPPFGTNLFYLRAIISKEIPMSDIYLSVVPWVGLQAIGLATVMVFPQIALWLPGMMNK